MEISAFATLLQNVKGGAQQFTARCPAHGDQHNSLSVGLGEDGRILLKCHAGCDTAAVLAALGLRPADLFPDAPGTPPGAQKQGGRGPKRVAEASLNASATAAGRKTGLATGKTGAAVKQKALPGAALQAAVAGFSAHGETDDGAAVGGERAHGETDLQKCKKDGMTIYDYHLADGSVLFQVVRKNLTDGGKSFTQRRPNGKGGYLYSLKGVEPVLYRLPQVLLGVAAGGDVMVCEGEKDADALAALGLCATTAPMGAGKWRESYTEALRGATRVVVTPDNDKAGRAHALAVCTSLAAAGVPALVADLRGLYPALPRKGDVSDVLQMIADELAAGPGGATVEEADFSAAVAARLSACAVEPALFARLALQRDQCDEELLAAEDLAAPPEAAGKATPAALAAAGQAALATPANEEPPYRFDTSADYLKKAFWDDIARSAEQKGISTGFKGLDAQLEGRLYPGLYVVGSVSSLGKTALCLQMADAIAAQGVDVLFFTLEMGRAEMVARSLTRHLFTGGSFAGAYNVGHVLHGRVPADALEAAAQRYHQASARHIAFLEGDFGMGVAQVADTVTRHTAATGRRPVVFVDYLQILRPPDTRMSDKQATDHNVIELKRLSRDFEVPVIAVSSFNRQNYAEEVNMASFKESGAIEYSADFVLGLQARGISHRADDTADEKKLARLVKGQTKDAKKQDPRPIEAVTLKNRRGPAWAVFDLDFYPRQNYFAEV